MNDLIKVIQHGLSLKSLEPFSEIAHQLGVSEREVIGQIQTMKENKTIKRFGPVLHNRTIGFKQNAMTTLRIPVARIESVGMKIASFDFVTLCYEREPIPDVWNYNLYFMIHGKERAIVEQQIREVLSLISEDVEEYKILFSSHCFKQKGASY